MLRLPNTMTQILAKGGPFVGDNRPTTRITVQASPTWWLYPQYGPLGNYPGNKFPIRWWQTQANTQNETEIPNLKTCIIDRSLSEDADTIEVDFYNTLTPADGTAGPMPEVFGDPGALSYNYGITGNPWNQTPNAFANLLRENALLRVYQGYGGYQDPEGNPYTVEEAVTNGNIMLTGVFLVDSVAIEGQTGIGKLVGRSMAKLLIDQPLWPPLVPSAFYEGGQGGTIGAGMNYYHDLPVVHSAVVGYGSPTNLTPRVATIEWIQDAAPSPYNATAATATATFARATTIGHWLIFVCTCGDGGGTTISGGGVSTWIEASSGDNPEGNSKSCDIWYGAVDTTGQTVVTITDVAGAHGAAGVGGEFSGIDNASPVGDVFANGDSGADTILACAKLPASAGQLYVGGGFIGSGIPAPYTPSSGFVTFPVSAATAGAVAKDIGAWQITTAAADMELDFTAGSSGDFASNCALFNPNVSDYTQIAPLEGWPKSIFDMQVMPDAQGYRMVGTDGGVFDYGSAYFFGSEGSIKINAEAIAMDSTPTGGGYWICCQDGGVFNFGDAGFHGSGVGQVASTVVGFRATSTGNGYWICDTEGNIYSYGDATYHGGIETSPGNIVAFSPRPQNDGYWMLDANGAVYSFGAALYHGGLNTVSPNPLTGLSEVAATAGIDSNGAGTGYRIATSIGGVYDFGSAQYFTPSAGNPISGELNAPICNIRRLPNDTGFYLVAEDGGIFTFGAATFYGSLPADYTAHITNYADYTDIVIDICLWAGFFLYQTGLGPGDNIPIFGNMQLTGAWDEVGPLDPSTFDKVQCIDAIKTIRDAVGFLFRIREDGSCFFASPNIWDKGNIYSDGTPTSYIPTFYDTKNITDYIQSTTDQTLVSEIVVSSVDPYLFGGTPALTTVTTLIPPNIQSLHGIQKPAMIGVPLNVPVTTADQQIMAEIQGLFCWLGMRTGQLSTIVDPSICPDDQIQIFERSSGETAIHYVTGVHTEHDLDSGQWLATYTTQWQGVSDNWAITSSVSSFYEGVAGETEGQLSDETFDVNGNLIYADTFTITDDMLTFLSKTYTAGGWPSTQKFNVTIAPPVTTPPPTPTHPGPSNVTPPVVSGGTEVGDEVTVTNGTWLYTPTSFTYQWRRSGTVISGAIDQNYTSVDADTGDELSCSVKAINAYGNSVVSSNSTAAITNPSPPPPPPTGLDPNAAFSRKLSTYSGVTVASNSATIISHLVTYLAASGFGWGINLGSDGKGASIIITTSATPRVSVLWTGTGASKTMIGGSTANATTGTIGTNGVPIPIGTEVGGPSGTDHPVMVYVVDTDEYYELWVGTPYNSSNVAQSASVAGGHWTADYGGYTANFSTGWGLFPCDPPTSGAPSFGNGYGTQAAGTCGLATAITQADVKSGVIAHTISWDAWSSGLNGHVAPAIRDDDGSASNGIAEGAWVTWKPGTIMPSGLAPLAQMIWVAIRDYGAICVDMSGDYTFACEQAQVNGSLGADATDYIHTACDGVPEYQLFSNSNWPNSYWGNLELLTPPTNWPTNWT